ncbi:hypothetical protein EDC04DRAFT_2517096, partial [Pisolithus marmoratus]
VNSFVHLLLGALIASGHCDHVAQLWNVQTEVQTGDLLQGHTGQVDSYSVVFSPD